MDNIQINTTPAEVNNVDGSLFKQTGGVLDFSNTKLKVGDIPNMHKFLTGFDRYNQKIPYIIEDFFTPEELEILMEPINKGLENKGVKQYHGEVSEEGVFDRYRPKISTYMSRLILEFDIHERIQEKLDRVAHPIHKDPMRLTHWNYLDYNLKYSDGKVDPELRPHIDADENLVTLNYCLDANIDWPVYVDGVPYHLKKNSMLIFSAVNQIHWRPKRNFKEGEFVKIISFDWCPPTSYRWQNQPNPIDPDIFPEHRWVYSRHIGSHPLMNKYWEQYNAQGIKDGVIDKPDQNKNA